MDRSLRAIVVANGSAQAAGRPNCAGRFNSESRLETLIAPQTKFLALTVRFATCAE
jgi:hypothetical protein